MGIDTTEVGLYGIGRGAAQVWGENKALKGLQIAQQQDQLRRQKEDAELNEQLAKVNYDAARNEDLPEILKQYQGIKNTFAKIRGTQNSMDRIRLMTELNNQKADITRSVALSKQAGQQLGELGKLRLSKPDDISDDFVGNYKTLSGMSVFDPKFKELADITSTTALVPKFNANLFNKSILDRSIKPIEGGDYQKLREKGMDVYRKKEGTELNADNVLKNTINSYATDRSFRRFIDREFKGIPVEEAIKTYAADLYVGNKDAYNKVKNIDKAQFDQRVAPMTAYQRYRIANGLDLKTDKPVLERQQWIEDLTNNVANSGERLSGIMMGRGYDKPLKIERTKDGRKITYVIPPKTDISTSTTETTEDGETVEKEKTTKKVIPGRRFTIDVTEAGYRHKLNEVLNELTGENIKVSKYTTGEPSGKIKGERVSSGPAKAKPTTRPIKDSLGLFKNQ